MSTSSIVFAPVACGVVIIALSFTGAAPAPENHVDPWQMDGAATTASAAPVLVPPTCPETCSGDAYSVWRFPPGSRSPDDAPGTRHPNGWKVRAELGERPVAIFEPGARGEVARMVMCRQRGASMPEPACYWSATVETADLFADGFESGDVGAWTRSTP